MFRLRLLRFLLLWLVRPRKGLLEKHLLTMRAWPIIDVDVTRMMVHAFSRALVMGRYQLVFGSEFRSFALRRRWFPVTAAEMTSIYKPIRLLEKFTVTSELTCWNERRFYAEQRIWAGGELRCRSIIEGVIGGPEGFLNPKQVFSDMGVVRESPPFTPEIQTWIENRPKMSDITAQSRGP